MRDKQNLGLIANYLPFVAAVAINGLLIALGGLVTVRTAIDKSEDTIGEFFTKNDQPAPPSGGSTAANEAALNQALTQMMASAPTTVSASLAAITTTAPSPVSFEVTPPQPMAPSPSALFALQPANPRTEAGTTQATGETTGKTGQGTGVGTNQGTSRAIGEAGWNTSSKTAKGNVGPGWNRPGKDALKNQDIIIILDLTLRRPGDTDITPEAQSLLNTLRQTNNVLGELTCLSGAMASKSNKANDTVYDDILDANGRPQTAYSDAKNVKGIWQGNSAQADRVNAYHSVLDACQKYAGKKATIVVISDFLENDNNTADVEPLAKALINAELRLYLITIDDVPAASAYTVARQSGGDVRRVYSAYWQQMDRTQDGIPWADPQSRSLLRNLDR